MLKKRISYVDFEGEEREEDFYFYLSEAEVTEMEMSSTGGLSRQIERLIELKDGSKIIGLFKDIILKAYGEKSPDGRRFIKNDQLSEEFSQTGAFNKLFMELATDADAASEFINGILPKEVKDKLPNDSKPKTAYNPPVR